MNVINHPRVEHDDSPAALLATIALVLGLAGCAIWLAAEVPPPADAAVETGIECRLLSARRSRAAIRCEQRESGEILAVLELDCAVTGHGRGAGRSLRVVAEVEKADGSLESWLEGCGRAAFAADSQQLMFQGVACAPSGCPAVPDVRCRGMEP